MVSVMWADVEISYQNEADKKRVSLRELTGAPFLRRDPSAAIPPTLVDPPLISMAPTLTTDRGPALPILMTELPRSSRMSIDPPLSLRLGILTWPGPAEICLSGPVNSTEPTTSTLYPEAPAPDTETPVETNDPLAASSMEDDAESTGDVNLNFLRLIAPWTTPRE